MTYRSFCKSLFAVSLMAGVASMMGCDEVYNFRSGTSEQKGNAETPVCQENGNDGCKDDNGCTEGTHCNPDTHCCVNDEHPPVCNGTEEAGCTGDGECMEDGSHCDPDTHCCVQNESNCLGLNESCKTEDDCCDELICGANHECVDPSLPTCEAWENSNYDSSRGQGDEKCIAAKDKCTGTLKCIKGDFESVCAEGRCDIDCEGWNIFWGNDSSKGQGNDKCRAANEVGCNGLTCKISEEIDGMCVDGECVQSLVGCQYKSCDNGQCENGFYCDSETDCCEKTSNCGEGMICSADDECHDGGNKMYCDGNCCMYCKGEDLECSRNEECCENLSCSNGNCQKNINTCNYVNQACNKYKSNPQNASLELYVIVNDCAECSGT